MLALCLKIINAATTKLNIIIGADWWNMTTKSGKIIPAIIEEAETILVMTKPANQVKIINPSIMPKLFIRKDKPIRTPKVVATPLPPLKLRNIVHICPIIAMSPSIRRSRSGWMRFPFTRQ